MAHFAEIKDGKVVQVLTVPNEEETRGQEFLANDLGLGGTWVQTSYNANFGGKFAAIGDDWDGTVFTTPVNTEKEAEIAAKESARNAIAAKLGITVEEVRALLS